VFFVIKHSPVWALPIVTSNVINAATEGGAGAVHTIIINVAIMVALVLQNIPTNYVHTWLYAKTIRVMELELRSALVRKLQQLSISYHNAMQSGRLQSKIMRDVEQIETLSSQLFITVLSIILNIVVSFVVVISKSLTVFYFFLAAIPVAVIIMYVFRSRIKKYNSDFRSEMEETSARVMEMVELIPVTRAHALEDTETKKMDNQLEHVAKTGLKLDMIQTFFGSVSWVAFQLFQVICLAFTSFMAAQKKISIGEVVMYQTYFGTIVSQISSILGLLPIISKGLESVDSVGDILLSNDVEDSGSKEKLERVNGEISFEHMNFRYRDGTEDVLHDLNLHIKAGETVAFVGGSGAGKTTILNLVIGFLRPTSGSVLIDGKDLNTLDLKSYRSHLSVVPQQSILFTGTIRENITYGRDDISDEQLATVVKAANLDDLISTLPDGLETKLTEHGSNLSGGQKQRISIARAFIRNPQILILDEATSALDSFSEQKIQNAIQNLVRNRTTLIVAHRLSTIRNADHIAVIGEGGLEEYGTFTELMEKKGEFYRLHELQA
jgi:ATP-binding cassette subfamily B protein